MYLAYIDRRYGKIMKITEREQDAIDGLKFCLRHNRRMFRVDVLIVLHLLGKLLKNHNG